jgi:hypothetical protein
MPSLCIKWKALPDYGRAWELFIGSSPNSGESCPYFEEEIFIVEKAISHSFYHFDFVVDAFK